jgi:hypothetical protein
MINARHIILAGILAVAAASCGSSAPPGGSTGIGGIGGSTGTGGVGGSTGTGTGGSAMANTIKLEVWMDGIAKNGEVDVNTMPDNVLFTVTDKRPVSAAEAATAPADPGKLTVIYDEDPAALRPLLEADPRFIAP